MQINSDRFLLSLLVVTFVAVDLAAQPTGAIYPHHLNAACYVGICLGQVGLAAAWLVFGWWHFLVRLVLALAATAGLSLLAAQMVSPTPLEFMNVLGIFAAGVAIPLAGLRMLGLQCRGPSQTERGRVAGVERSEPPATSGLGAHFVGPQPPVRAAWSTEGPPSSTDNFDEPAGMGQGTRPQCGPELVINGEGRLEDSDPPGGARRWQFSMAGLFVATTAVAIVLAALERTEFPWQAAVEVLCYCLGFTVAAWISLATARSSRWLAVQVPICVALSVGIGALMSAADGSRSDLIAFATVTGVESATICAAMLVFHVSGWRLAWRRVRASTRSSSGPR